MLCRKANGLVIRSSDKDFENKKYITAPYIGDGLIGFLVPVRRHTKATHHRHRGLFYCAIMEKITEKTEQLSSLIMVQQLLRLRRQRIAALDKIDELQRALRLLPIERDMTCGQIGDKISELQFFITQTEEDITTTEYMIELFKSLTHDKI